MEEGVYQITMRRQLLQSGKGGIKGSLLNVELASRGPGWRASVFRDNDHNRSQGVQGECLMSLKLSSCCVTEAGACLDIGIITSERKCDSIGAMEVFIK